MCDTLKCYTYHRISTNTKASYCLPNDDYSKFPQSYYLDFGEIRLVYREPTLVLTLYAYSIKHTYVVW